MATEMKRGVCPNCPGPRVPHHCGLVSAYGKGKRDRLFEVGGKGKSVDVARKRCDAVNKADKAKHFGEQGHRKNVSNTGNIKGAFPAPEWDDKNHDSNRHGKGKSEASCSRRRFQERVISLEGEVPISRGHLLGKGGQNFKYICEETGVRLVLEYSDEMNATGADNDREPTQLRVISNTRCADLEHAVRLVSDLINSVCEERRAQSGNSVKQPFRKTGTDGLLKAAVDAERLKITQFHNETAQLCAEAKEKARSLVEQLQGDTLSERKKHLDREIEAAKNDAVQSAIAAVSRTRNWVPDPEACPVLLGQAARELPKPIQVRILEHKAKELKKDSKRTDRLVSKLQTMCERDAQTPDGFLAVAKTIRSISFSNGSGLSELEGLLSDAAKNARAADAAEQRVLELCADRTVGKATGPPTEGVLIERCGASQIADLKSMWSERKARVGQIVDAWKIDNPLLTWHFNARREELKKQLGRCPDELQGYHGTHPCNVLSICQNGFDRSKRAGQVYGSGEYFAKCPDVSLGYCRGGEYMLVCRLCLGVPSSNRENSDGDHIWVPSCSYYVISSPAQVLPLYIVKFSQHDRLRISVGCSPPNELRSALESGRWTTKKFDTIVPVPRNRKCTMSRLTATVLWIGFLHAHLSDQQLDQDVRIFLQNHAPEHIEGLKVQIVKGHFKKAHAILKIPIPRELVHKLNRLPFSEGGIERTVCVEDAHGSPEQKCPKWIAGYCRGQNLRFTHPCWCLHPERETTGATYHLEDIRLTSAKGNEIMDKFMKSSPFHDGQPQIVGIRAIINNTLARCHEGYRQYLITKYGEEPTVRELYHGTNNKILDVLYTHGLQPPSDVKASNTCPMSGGKGLCTTLCGNDCQYCTEKHEWNKCHMFGLGIYLADIAQKSHRYCSQPEATSSGKRRFRMIVCSVLGRAFTFAGHLRQKDAMHDVVTVRALQEDDLAGMIEPCCSPCSPDSTFGSEEIAEKSDLLFVQGLGCGYRPGFSVVNSEYIAFHPHQCMPKYEITYYM